MANSQASISPFSSHFDTDFPSNRETTIMFFSPNRTNEPYLLFEKFSRENHGKYHFGTLVDDGVAKWPHHPALIFGKPYERVSKVIFNHEDLSEEGIQKYIEEGIRPSIVHIHHFSLNKNFSITCRRPRRRRLSSPLVGQSFSFSIKRKRPTLPPLPSWRQKIKYGGL